MGKLGNALILSPFATHPLDAGQRKRAFQTTTLLKEWGFSITFLHFAFETRWYWGHNSEDDSVLRDQWDGDVLHFYANKKVGLPPASGGSHQLDEWWDDALGGYINNIFSKRQYDLFVVHNIWLSKAFDYAPNHCLKVLEMHDLFSQRAKEFEATGVSPEFFYCSERDEVFGLKRADLLLAIKQEDADWCMARDIGNTKVITIPYVEKHNLGQIGPGTAISTKPVHPGKVVFGMIGSDIHFNRHAVHALTKELDAVIRQTYAPIEFVLAGAICRSIGECQAFIRKLGFVNDTSDFYATVDVVVVPMLYGTGVKIKSAEALSHGKPVLFTSHSAQGTCYAGRVYETLREMSLAMADIAMNCAVPAELSDNTLSAHERQKAMLEKSRTSFQARYLEHRPGFVFLLGSSHQEAVLRLLDYVANAALYKQLSSWFRSTGLAVHPCCEQFLPSVFGRRLPRIDHFSELSIACSISRFIVSDYSQKSLIERLLLEHKSLLAFLDCRTAGLKSLSLLLSDSHRGESRIHLMVTPRQASLLSSAAIMGDDIVVLPLLADLVKWDPHVSAACQDLINVHTSLAPWLGSELRDELSELGLILHPNDKGLTSYDHYSAFAETKQQIKDLLQLFQGNSG